MSTASTFREDSENNKLSFERLKLFPMDVTHHDEKDKYVSTGQCAWRSWNEPATRLWTPDKEQALKACRVCCSRRPPEVARTKMTRSCVEVEWSPEGRGLWRFGKIGSQPLCGDVSHCTRGLVADGSVRPPRGSRDPYQESASGFSTMISIRFHLTPKPIWAVTTGRQ